MWFTVLTVIAAAELAVWVFGPLVALLQPRRHPDPHDGIAVGCLTLFMIPGIILAILLTIGLLADKPLLVKVVVYALTVPLAWGLLGVIAYPIRRAIQKRRERQWEV